MRSAADDRAGGQAGEHRSATDPLGSRRDGRRVAPPRPPPTRLVLPRGAGAMKATKPTEAPKPPAVPPEANHQMEMLRERALATMERAYAPYSKFRVGAALL